MILLVVLSLSLSVFMVVYGLKNFKIDEEMRDFLKPVLSWIAIGFVFLLIYLVLGGG